MRRPPGRVLLAVALLVAAGCVSPTARPTPDDAETDEPSAGPAGVTVRGGDLPLDADRTFDRTTRLLDAGADPPTLYVSDPARASNVTRDPRDLRGVLGLGRPRPSAVIGPTVVGGATSPLGTVYVVPGAEADAGAIERTLAHEYVHVVQFDRGAVERLRDAAPDAYVGTTDARLARRSLLEGGAVYVADVYTERYLEGTRTESAQLRELYPQASAGTRYFWAPYFYGSRYVADQVDSPAGLLALYADAPLTTEQVLHDETPETEPARMLLVQPVVATPAWDHRETDTKGELFVRVVLTEHLDEERAATAAAGWGRDRAVRFAAADGTGEGYAWVLRWDTAADAAEFGAALRSYLDAEATPRNGTWTAGDRAFRLRTVSDRTLVLFAGDPGFVERATASGVTDDVTVRVGERTEGAAVATAEADRPSVALSAGVTTVVAGGSDDR